MSALTLAIGCTSWVTVVMGWLYVPDANDIQAIRAERLAASLQTPPESVMDVNVKPPKAKPTYATELPSNGKLVNESVEDLTASSKPVTPTFGYSQEEEGQSVSAAPVAIQDTSTASQRELEFEVTFDWSVRSGDHSFRNIYELKYGLLPNLELGIEVPLTYGDGRVKGNGDVDLVGKYRIRKERDWVPSIAVGLEVRLPTGIDSTGVDAAITLILTKSFGRHRVHLNAEAKAAGGHNIEGVRRFQWAFGFGYDHPIWDSKTLFVADYYVESGEEKESGCSNIMELGVERELAKHHKLGLGLKVGLDDSEETPNVGLGVKYVYGSD